MVQIAHYMPEAFNGTTGSSRLSGLEPVDLPLSSQKRRNLDLQEESGLEDEKSSRTTEEEVERPQQPFKRSR